MNIKNRKYIIIPYDSNWPILFAKESKKISRVIGDNILDIQHIGSTSVPGMSGKPTVDILFVVKDISKIKDKISNLINEGYIFLGSPNDKNSFLFEKEVDGDRLFIIHFYQKDHPEIIQMIAIRDYLRKHKDEANKYSEYKLSLFKQFPNEYSQYRKMKDRYMNKLMKVAIIRI